MNGKNVPAAGTASADAITDLPGALTGLLTGIQSNPQQGLGTLCNLSDAIASLNANLQKSLGALTGPGGVPSLAGLTSSQSITSTEDKVTATSKITGLKVLGQSPFAKATALTTTSTASTTGKPGGATATIDSTVADLQGGQVHPFASVRATLDGLTTGVPLLSSLKTLNAALATSVSQVVDGLNSALAPIGVSVSKRDGSADPTALVQLPDRAERPADRHVHRPGRQLRRGGHPRGQRLGEPAGRPGRSPDDQWPAAQHGPRAQRCDRHGRRPDRQHRSGGPGGRQHPSRTPALAYTGADLPLTGGLAALLVLAVAAALRRRRTHGAHE